MGVQEPVPHSGSWGVAGLHQCSDHEGCGHWGHSCCEALGHGWATLSDYGPILPAWPGPTFASITLKSRYLPANRVCTLQRWVQTKAGSTAGLCAPWGTWVGMLWSLKQQQGPLLHDILHSPSLWHCSLPAPMGD